MAVVSRSKHRLSSPPTARQRWGTGAICALGLCLAIVSSAAFVPARAQVPTLLDSETCRTLLGERDRLVETGAETHLKRGPEWAQQNLSPQQIGRVGALIKLDEQLKFRCPVGFNNEVVAGIRAGRRVAVPPRPMRAPSEVQARRRQIRAQTQVRGNGPPLPLRNDRRGNVRSEASQSNATTGLRGSLADRSPNAVRAEGSGDSDVRSFDGRGVQGDR